MAQSTSVKSFQEVYKTSYSHGLEDIYALENVDLSTVRPLQSDLKNSSPKPVQLAKPALSKDDPQACFNMGMEYRGSIEHFALKEPIQVLGLTRYIENSLLNQGIKVLGELLNPQACGFGKGHRDEIEQKLQEYLAGRHLHKSRTIDFRSWVRAIVGDLDKKKLMVMLEPHELQYLFSLSSSESIELRRLTLEKRQEWCEEIEKALLSEAKKHQVDKDFCQITEVFIKPWMNKRFGIATELELLERLQALSECGDYSEPFLNFFSCVYFKNSFPLGRYLEPLGPNLFASEGWIADQYDQIVEKTLSYFYRPELTYPLEALVAFLEREFSKTWVGFREGFLLKVLKLSPKFFIHKNISGVLHISLA